MTSNNLQNLSYGYDKFGNLAFRKDETRNLEEHFEYDHLNRLKVIKRGMLITGTMEYDPYGRMTKKVSDNTIIFSDARYDINTKPHAIDEATCRFGIIPEEEQNITYTCFDKVKTITEGDNTLAYTYGYDRQRIFMEEHANGIDRTKRYVGSCEFITKTENNVTTASTLTYLTSPTGVFAVVEQQDETERLHYILKDHQGNWTVIVDAEGEVEQELSYDAWGNLRDPETWCVDASITPMFDRGYTGHEHLNGFGLINMNGRMYDPVISSFLSVDRYVQQPENSQGFNRYAYCMYNPLKYVDPSGWRQSLPNGHGIAPPPDGDETGYYVTGVYTYTGFNNEYYSYNYGLNEVTVTPYGNSWAMEECRRLGEQNCGGLSAEYSGGEANVPTLSAGGGGGGGFWTGGNNTSTKEYGLSSSIFSFPTAAVGTLLGASSYSYKQMQTSAEFTELGKSLSKAQKAKLAAKYPTELSKRASAAKYGAKYVDVMAGKLKNAGVVFGAVGVGISVYDAMNTDVIRPSNVYEITTSMTCFALCFCTGPVGWIAGAVFIGAEVFSYAYTGMSVGENLNQRINWSYSKQR